MQSASICFFLLLLFISFTDVRVGTYEQVFLTQKKLKRLIKNQCDGLRVSCETATPISIMGKVEMITGAYWSITSAATKDFTSS